MDDLPESLLMDIFSRIKRTSDRNSLSLVCKGLRIMEGRERAQLRVGRGLHPASEALDLLCNRFPNLSEVEIDYSGWTYKYGRQLTDKDLLILSSRCPSLTCLKLSFCSFITDTGISYLSFCRKLSSLKLNFSPSVSSNGLLSFSIGCKNLTTLHLSRLMNVKSVVWLEYLGKMGNLEDLSIKNCKGIEEGDLLKLGPGWRNLKRLEFELDKNYIASKTYSHLTVHKWQKQLYPCEQLRELHLAYCITNPSRGFSCVMSECEILEKLTLDMCSALSDRDISCLAQNSGRLKSISLHLPAFISLSEMLNNSTLTDASLSALARGCSMLEEVSISFHQGNFPYFYCFSLGGVINLIQSCPIRILVLDGVGFFNDSGMEALCSASVLEALELVLCQDVSDVGLLQVRHYPCLTRLTLCKCLSVSDHGLKPLVDSNKLESLAVIDCPRISEKGTKGSARSVSYRHDLSWLS